MKLPNFFLFKSCVAGTPLVTVHFCENKVFCFVYTSN